MTTATLSTVMTIPHYSDSPLEIQAEYTMHRDHTLDLHAVWMEVGGAEISVYHHLTPTQRAVLVEECRDDYDARMESVYDSRREQRISL